MMTDLEIQAHYYEEKIDELNKFKKDAEVVIRSCLYYTKLPSVVSAREACNMVASLTSDFIKKHWGQHDSFGNNVNEAGNRGAKKEDLD